LDGDSYIVGFTVGNGLLVKQFSFFHHTLISSGYEDYSGRTLNLNGFAHHVLKTSSLLISLQAMDGTTEDLRGLHFPSLRYLQAVPDSIRQLPSIDNKRYFPIFACFVELIGY
jgi:hypothetical protein